MCGIVGYAGNRPAAKIIYEGLTNLEYRGYDSAGIATLSGGTIFVEKKQGRVAVLKDCEKRLSGNIGVGHTRWATHGKPSDTNAHPHVYGKFAVVHNGIIENYAELKKMYFDGEEFFSDTDSEVIVRLIDKFYDGDLLAALKCVCGLLKGSYAVAVICTDFEGLALMKRNNPAIIGYGDGENFVASDAPALSFCSTVTVLDDGDIALITGDGVSVFNSDLQGVIRDKIPNLATAASLELKDCPHYMLKEIREVPASVENTAAAFGKIRGAIKALAEGVNRVIFLGCGTAYNACLVAKRYIEAFVHIPAEADIAGEFRYKNPVVPAGTLIVAVTQSGETADTVEAAKLAKTLGAKVIAVTNAPYSEITRVAHAVVPVAAGSEICVAATKSYTGQITALYLLALTLAGQYSDEKISALPKLCKSTVDNVHIDTVADICARASGVYFLGRDIDYAVAQEGSLKLKEISYIPSEGYPAGELKHGTLALIDIRAVAVVIITSARLAEKSLNAVEQVLSRRGKVAVISNVEGIGKKLGGRAHLIEIPACDEYLSPLLSAIAVQLIAYKTALLLERDPDKPRNLAKSVTVE